MKATKEQKSNKGITLIALIITIIVMLVLVGVTITVAVNGGLFEYAGRAATKTNEAITAEQMLAEGKINIDGFWYDSMDDYLNGVYSENQPDAPIQMAYTLNITEATRANVTIRITPMHKEYVNYETYATAILEDLETKITDADQLKAAKEALLLEGINYWDINDDWWTGEGFDSLQAFTDYINEQDDTEYTDIYELMAAWYGSEEDDTEEQILEDYLLYYGDWYVKPEEYCNKYMITGIKPDNTEERVWPEGSYSYTVTANGNYTFKATNANGDKGAITVKVDNIIEEKYSSIYSKTELYTDKNGKTAWIPKGFAVGTNKSKNIEIDTVTNGLVITDAVDSEGNSIGNEFVWVPVNVKGTTQAQKEASFEAIRTDGYFKGSLQTYVSNEEISEPLTSGGYDGEVTDYNAMRTSIIEHGGFYIGRYEAGSEIPRYNTSNGTTTMSVKRNKYPYNYVAWGSTMGNYTSTIGDDGNGAVYLSKNMYIDDTKYGVTSTLCYGIQWDAIMKFVEDSTHSISNSTNWGNYRYSSFKYTGAYCGNPISTKLPNWIKGNNSSKSTNSSRLLTTGASETNKAKNIYDLAGNVREWTMEAYFDSWYRRVMRGGYFDVSGNYEVASSRVSNMPAGSHEHTGFRPSLYVE